eukprot:gene3202-5518_t
MKKTLTFLKTKKQEKEKQEKKNQKIPEEELSPQQKDPFNLSTIDKRKSASFSGKIPQINTLEVDDHSFDIEFNSKSKQKNSFVEAFDRRRRSVFHQKKRATEVPPEIKIEKKSNKDKDHIEGLDSIQVEEVNIEPIEPPKSFDEILATVEATEASTPRGNRSDSKPKFKHVRTKTIQKKSATILSTGGGDAPPVEEKEVTKQESHDEFSRNKKKSKTDLELFRSMPQQKYVPNTVLKRESMPKNDAMKIIAKTLPRWNMNNRLRKAYKKGAFCKQNRMRQQLIKEIYHTEEEYVKALLTLTVVYYYPLQKKKLIEPEDLHTIFGNIPMILELQTNFMASMADELKGISPKIGKTFVEFAPYLKVYPEYINNYDDTIGLLNELQATKKGFDKFLREQIQLPECGNLPLESFLIKPIQRIPRYKLLLRDLVKETPEHHIEYENLITAYEKINYVAGFVNEQKREAENRKVVLNLSANLPSKVQDSLLKPTRKLLKHGKVIIKKDEIKKDEVETKFESKELELYLFNDLILLIDDNEDKPTQINFEFSIVQIPEKEKIMKVFTTLFRIRYLITIKFPEKDFEKWSGMVKETSEKVQEKSSIKSEIAIEDFVKIEKERVEIANIFPIVHQERVDILKALKNDDHKISTLTNDLESNREKLRKLQELIAQQEIELKTTKDGNKIRLEKKATILDEFKKNTDNAIALDKKILKIVQKDNDKYKKIFNCTPMEEEKVEPKKEEIQNEPKEEDTKSDEKIEDVPSENKE